jgi:hypothetical protein
MSEDVEDEMLFENGKSMSYYIALLYADDGVEVDNSKVPTLINLTKNPFQDALDHNQGLIKHRFAGKNSGAKCKLQLVIGPVNDLEKAVKIRDEWKNNSRGLLGRGAEGRLLARRFKVKCFDSYCDRVYASSNNTRRKKPQKKKTKNEPEKP